MLTKRGMVLCNSHYTYEGLQPMCYHTKLVDGENTQYYGWKSWDTKDGRKTLVYNYIRPSKQGGFYEQKVEIVDTSYRPIAIGEWRAYQPYDLDGVVDRYFTEMFEQAGVVRDELNIDAILEGVLAS